MINVASFSEPEEKTFEQTRLEKNSLEYATTTAREFGYPEDAIGRMIKTTSVSDLGVGDVVFLGSNNAKLMKAKSISLYSAPEGAGYASISPRNKKEDRVLHVGQKLRNIRFPVQIEPVYIIRNGIDLPTG